MLDADLAELYGVPTKVLVRTVKRAAARVPPDFMFQLAPEEFANLRSQFVTSSWGGRGYPPYAFTGTAWRCCPVSRATASAFGSIATGKQPMNRGTPDVTAGW